MKTILITGGLGYIGSHAVVAFEKAGYKTVIIDNLDNSCLSTYRRIDKILGYKPPFYEADIRDYKELDKIFEKHKIDGVIHFAGSKIPSESIEEPFKYFDNNVIGSIRLFEIMKKYNVKNIIFSSSAAVYDLNNTSPIDEKGLVGNTHNPYGTTKFIIEKILSDLAEYANFKVINLRYFNPIGAHSTGLIGESPDGTPGNLFPFIMKVIMGDLEELKVFGNDYSTSDGTGVRDYIDINDLIEGHIKSYNHLEKRENENDGYFETFNLGVGRGVSVLELISICEKESGQKVKYKIVDRRPGDLGSVYCEAKKAKEFLGWESKTPLEESVKNALKFYEIEKGEEK